MDFLTGKSSVYSFLFALFLLIVFVAVKVLNMLVWTPGKVGGEVDEIFQQVEDISPMSLRKAEFLILWGNYRESDDCSDAVTSSRDYPGNGFQNNTYIVVYPDSVQFPGLPTLHREVRIERTISNR